MSPPVRWLTRSITVFSLFSCFRCHSLYAGLPGLSLCFLCFHVLGVAACMLAFAVYHCVFYVFMFQVSPPVRWLTRSITVFSLFSCFRCRRLYAGLRGLSLCFLCFHVLGVTACMLAFAVYHCVFYVFMF